MAAPRAGGGAATPVAGVGNGADSILVGADSAWGVSATGGAVCCGLAVEAGVGAVCSAGGNWGVEDGCWLGAAALDHSANAPHTTRACV